MIDCTITGDSKEMVDICRHEVGAEAAPQTEGMNMLSFKNCFVANEREPAWVLNLETESMCVHS